MIHEDYAIVCVTQDENRFIWEVHALLESIKMHNPEWIPHTYIAILKLQSQFKAKWRVLPDIYPGVKLRFYEVEIDSYLTNLMKFYHTVFRPYLLSFLFQEISADKIIYLDTDVILTKHFPLEEFSKDGVCYMSSTTRENDYMSHEYFLSKRKDVLPDKLEEYDKEDVLDNIARIGGITKQMIIDNKENTGGVQYVIDGKGIDSEFWKKVFVSSFIIRSYLMNINQRYFKGLSPQDKENNGIQSWCADLWATLYTLWHYGKKTSCPTSMDFAWATDYIEKLDRVYFFHNAGITAEEYMIIRDGKKIIQAPAFYKGRFQKVTPEKDIAYLDMILQHPVSQKYCTWYYVDFLKRMFNKYQISY